MRGLYKFVGLIALPFAIAWSICLGTILLVNIGLNVAQRAIDTALRRVFTPRAIIEPIHPLDQVARMLWKSELTNQDVKRITAAFPEIKYSLFFEICPEESHRRALQNGRSLDKLEAATDRYLSQHGGDEFIVRKALFAAALDRKLRLIGTSLEEMIDDAFIPTGIERALSDSVDEALYLVFDLPPKGPGALERLSRGLRIPILVYNSVKLIAEYFPTAGLRLIRPISRAKLLAGDFSPLSREIVGTAIFAFVLFCYTT